MPKIVFTSNLARHIDCPELKEDGSTLRELLDNAFCNHTKLRNYVLDDQGRLRKHMLILVDGKAITDRVHLGDTLETDSEVYILQALSGG